MNDGELNEIVNDFASRPSIDWRGCLGGVAFVLLNSVYFENFYAPFYSQNKSQLNELISNRWKLSFYWAFPNNFANCFADESSIKKVVE